VLRKEIRELTPTATLHLAKTADWVAITPDSVWVVVGPEGGLSEDEVATFAAAGAVPVSLGRQILRTETASVVAAALVLQHFGRLG